MHVRRPRLTQNQNLLATLNKLIAKRISYARSFICLHSCEDTFLIVRETCFLVLGELCLMLRETCFLVVVSKQNKTTQNKLLFSFVFCFCPREARGPNPWGRCLGTP